MTHTVLFDDTQDALLDGDVHGAMDGLYDRLANLRAELPADQWLEFGDALRRHPLHDLVLHSPFARRAFEKPRGYAGDAALIDLIYGCGPSFRSCSTLGEVLYSWEFELPTSRSVRHRRMCLAREIDQVAVEQQDASVLSLACGHLREAELSTAVRESRVRITALDQDRESVAMVDADYGIFGVTAQVGSVRDILRRRLVASDVVLVCTAGLYDYLDGEVGGALASALFAMLAPGGRLLLANVTPDVREAGYLEACMDWRLIYRDERNMLGLLDTIPESEIERIDQFRDPGCNVTYMRVVRR